MFERKARAILLLCWYFVVAAACFSGFVGKWGLRDLDDRYGFASVMSGQADRPFAYRVLLPSVINAIDAVVPEEVKAPWVQQYTPGMTFRVAALARDPQYGFRHLLMCYGIFLALLLSQYAVVAWLVAAGFEKLSSVVATAAMTLALPYLATVGGYYYDAWEILWLGLACLCATKGHVFRLVVVSAIGVANKESFLLFLPSLLPLLVPVRGRRDALLAVSAALVIGVLIHVSIRSYFAANPGGALEFHLYENVRRYLNPFYFTYLKFELTYGLLGPAGASLFTLLVVWLVIRLGWRTLPRAIKWHGAVAGLIAFPMFLVFCATGELRNLSLCFPAFTAMMTGLVSVNCGALGTRVAQPPT